MSDKKRGFEDMDGDSSAAAKKQKSFEGASPDLIAQKRAELSAKIAAFAKSGPVSSFKPPTSALPIVNKPSQDTTTALAIPEDLARRVAEAKKRVAQHQTLLAFKENPYMTVPQASKKTTTRAPEPAQQGAGLKMAAHPLLLDNTPAAPQSKKDRYKPMQPKFASIKANVRNVPTPPLAPTPVPITENISANPYAQASSKETGFEGAPKERVGRVLRFNTKGKFIQIANQMRQESLLEGLKQRIAEGARKAGLDSEFETLEKNIRRGPPPEAEWWDAELLPSKSYSDIDRFGIESLKIHTNESPITIYIQHPIPIPGPQDKSKATLKPLMLTSRERKKMRKQKRAAELQDRRDRIAMGLLPPDAPKVRLSNLMKVLTSDAVQDPTRVEAKVRREVAMRKHQHEKANAERKLTDEQRREKIEEKKTAEERKGIHGAGFRINTLSDPSHRFKVRKNAQQRNLTGVCIFNPGFSLVYVEGAHKFIRQYKRTLLHRISWTEAARPRGAAEVEIASEEGGSDAEDTVKNAQAGPPDAEDEGAGQEVSLENNRCFLIWEGQIRDRVFTAFRAKSCPTDGAAKEFLGSKLAGYWDVAKNWKPEEEELF